jgi:SSS family solute:Na+ symporter
MTPLQHFGHIDLAIVLGYLLLSFALAMAVRRHAGRLENFMVAGRGVNVYLGTASLAATEMGLVSLMYIAQLGYNGGFAGIVVGLCFGFWTLLTGWTGFVVKRLRATGAATVPEVLEKTYGPRVRWWAGLVVALGGVLNMGVFLRVGGDFIVTFTGLGDGGWQVLGVHVGYLQVIMTGLLALALVYTITGGMISVLAADLMQFIVMGIGLVVATLFAVGRAGWPRMMDTVQHTYGAGGFDPFAHPSMGPAYVAYIFLFMFAGSCTWQTSVARLLSSSDATTAARIYRWAGFYFVGRYALPIAWGVAALVLVDHSLFPPGDPRRSALAMPAALAGVLPSGFAGLILASMLAAEMSTDSGYLLSWATVIVRDLIKPMMMTTGGRMAPRTEVLAMRLCVLAIGLFLVVFGLWYEVAGNIWEYLSVTGTIYMASLTSMLIAGLYWKRAHPLGAYLSLAIGALCPLAGLAYNQLALRGLAGRRVPDYWFGLAALLLSALAMIVGSLVGSRRRQHELLEGTVDGGGLVVAGLVRGDGRGAGRAGDARPAGAVAEGGGR